jgi:hypothetical protein
MNRFIFISGLIILVFLASLSLAEIPKMINYQGMLTGSDGKTPVPDANYNLTFKIYGSLAGTDSLWWEYHPNVPVTNGLFNIILGSLTTLNLSFDTTYCLGIKVGSDPELSPRIQLTSVGYAYRASVADSAVVAGSVGGAGGGWVDDGAVVRLETVGDSVGIGTATPAAKLDVNGDVNINSVYRIGGDTVLSTPALWNTFVGVGAGENNSGIGNTLVGEAAGGANTDGIDNTFVGRWAGYYHTTGHCNTFVGAIAGYSDTTGHANTYIGWGAGHHATGDSNVFIGHWAGMDESGSNKLYIANGGTVTDVLIYGDFSTRQVGIGTTSPTEKLDVPGTVKMSGFRMSTGAQDGYFLTSDGSGVGTWQPGLGASGTSNYIPKFTSATTFGNSVIYETSSKVGIGTTGPNSTLHVNGSLTKRFRSVSPPYTVTASDCVVVASTFGSIYLPTAVEIGGRVYTLKAGGTGNVTIVPNGTETIDTESSWTIWGKEAVTIVSDGANWWVIDEYITAIKRSQE